ncbi:GIN domain-containing protein [Litoribacter populi]|uniref:GIN domain-containing protein n=1 Tax=Litoribacter populi TaxID=2598460 RepID=UPI00163D5B22|nr:DUF2807 domain-containing protein [Litoribacter populi]
MSKIHLFFLGLFLISAVACSHERSGDYETTELSLDSFDKVHLTGGGRIHFIPSETYAVELKGHGVSDTEVKVEGNKLVLNNEGSSRKQNVDFYIYTKSIIGIQINGGGTVEIEEGFEAVKRFDCVIQGGGKLALEALEIGTLDISILGGGAVTAQVEEEIQANIIGGGSIQYLGNPEVKSSIIGGGSVKRMNK